VIAHYRNRKSGTQNKLKDVLLKIEFSESLTYIESMQRPEKNIDFLHVESLKNYCRKEFKRIDRNIERLPEMECVKIRKKVHAILRMIETEGPHFVDFSSISRPADFHISTYSLLRLYDKNIRIRV
jgi:hypothetical protein